MTLKKNRHLWLFGLILTHGVLRLALPPEARAEVSQSDFEALRQAVQKLGEQVESLQQSNQLGQQTHERDQEQLRQLQQKLSETQLMATNAEQKILEAAQTQPPPRQPLDEATVNHNFMLLGDAEIQYVQSQGQNGSFLLADFAPIFLYRAGENILFEAGFDTTLQDNAQVSGGSGGYTTTFNLSFAQLNYVLNDYVTFSGGYLLLPLGTYNVRNAGWLNMFPDAPLATELIPSAGTGAELQGGIPLGAEGALLNYQLFLANGPSSTDGTANAGSLDLNGNVGLTSNGTTSNLHPAPGGGGRIGVFYPIPYQPHYDFELGISGQSSQWDNSGNYLWSAGVVDAALHLGPFIEAKGEYILTDYGSADLGHNMQQGWWVQAGYKLAGLNLELPVINNLEVVGRFDSLLHTYDSNNNAFDLNTQRYTAGFIYYITNTLLFEGDYEFVSSNDPSLADQLILQLSLGF